MAGSDPTRPLRFQAAVERPLSVVFRASDGRWEGHDFRVEVITERAGLDAFDVVMDFRDLETALDSLLEPLRGRLFSDLGLSGPRDLADRILAELAPRVPTDVHLASIALTDGNGRRLVLMA